MAVDCKWTGAVSGDINTAGNWSGAGGVPSVNENVNVESSSVSLSASLAALDAVTGTDWTIGRTFSGSIGTASTALQLGTGTTLVVESPLCPIQNWDIETCTKTKVLETGTAPNACILKAGTYTDVYVNGGNLYIDGATVTNLYVTGPANVTVTASSTLSTKVEVFAGNVQVACALPATVNVRGGVLTHKGASVNCGTVTVSGGLFVPATPNSTITNVIAQTSGVADFTTISDERTVTASSAWAGGTIKTGTASHNVIWTAAIQRYLGGVVIGAPITAPNDV